MTPTAFGSWSDKLAIRELLERYMRHNDDGDLDRIVELFEDDATYQVMGRILVGREQIRDYLAGIGFASGRRAWTDDGQLLRQPRSAHLMANPVIDLDGDAATVESDFQVVRRDGHGRARIALVGRYRDRLRRSDGATWRIVNRTAVSLARPGEEDTDREWRRALGD